MQSGASVILDANRYNESTYEDPRFTFGEVEVEGDSGTLRLTGDSHMTFTPLGGRAESIEYARQNRAFAGDCVYFTQRHFLDRYQSGEAFEHENRRLSEDPFGDRKGL